MELREPLSTQSTFSDTALGAIRDSCRLASLDTEHTEPGHTAAWEDVQLVVMQELARETELAALLSTPRTSSNTVGSADHLHIVSSPRLRDHSDELECAMRNVSPRSVSSRGRSSRGYETGGTFET